MKNDLSTATVAVMLGTSANQVVKLLHKKELAGFKEGDRWRVWRVSVKNFQKRNPGWPEYKDGNRTGKASSKKTKCIVEKEVMCHREREGCVGCKRLVLDAPILRSSTIEYSVTNPRRSTR